MSHSILFIDDDFKLINGKKLPDSGKQTETYIEDYKRGIEAQTKIQVLSAKDMEEAETILKEKKEKIEYFILDPVLELKADDDDTTAKKTKKNFEILVDYNEDAKIVILTNTFNCDKLEEVLREKKQFCGIVQKPFQPPDAIVKDIKTLLRL